MHRYPRTNSYFSMKEIIEMISQKQFAFEIDRIIRTGLEEDIGDGDHSSLACIPEDARGKAKLLVKDKGIIAGVAFARQLYDTLNEDVQMDICIEDGNKVKHQDVVFYVEGSVHSILKSERLILNAMQRMSAIATKTRHFVDLLEGTGTQILDTRKTTPGIRALEKWAVTIGGGANHRFALYDMIMLKDNHIDFAGGIPDAINKTRRYLKQFGKSLDIIVEARNLAEVQQILDHGPVSRILLDNFSIKATQEAVALVDGRVDLESSGGINEKNMRDYALCGVEYISSGALTHSVYNMDLSLKAV